MSVATAVVQKLEKRLPKVIDARTHGVIDYCQAAFLLGLAVVCRKKNPQAALAAACTGGLVLTTALLTDYPLGVWKVIPFETRGQMDSGFAAASLAAPRILRFGGSAAANICKGNGLLEGAVASMTDYRSHRSAVGGEKTGQDGYARMAAD